MEAKVEVAELLTRRVFGRLATGAATLGLLPVTALGEPTPGHNSKTDLGKRPEDLSVSEWEEVRTRYANVMRIYGERLSPEQKQRIARILTTNEHMLASIRSFAVQNGDPSACTLRLDISK